MKIHIKYMVSLRCKLVVKSILEKMDLPYKTIELGEVDLNTALSDEQQRILGKELIKYGLEMLNDKKAVLIDRIKSLIVEMVHYEDELPKVKVSDYISEKLQHDYNFLSNIFSEVTGTTIENFIINHKIERAKELILYDELNITEIAFKLHYSSVAHLSNQFKKVTGLTPTYFKKLQQFKKRITIESI